MCVLATGISAGEVLGAFHRDAPYLSFWAQHSSGLLSAALAALRRKSRRIADYFFALRCVLRTRLWIQAIG
jgi:hypothetical protein